MALRGILLGDSQMKFLTRSRLHLSASVSACTFSFGGYDAPRLAEAVFRTGFRRADFAVLYVGGNDLDRSGADPNDICANIQALVVQLQRDVAPAVFVFKVLPRCGDSADARAKRRALNRRLTAALRRMPGVTTLNPEHRFLGSAKRPKRYLFAADGYHVCRFGGIRELAHIVIKALAQKYGQSILLPGRPVRREGYRVLQCSRCRAKGHSTDDCVNYCSPCQRIERRH